MLFRDVINLISITHSQNDKGDSIQNKTERKVFANKKSIRQTEFYQAAVTDFRPEIMFELRSAEYQGERYLSFGGKKYTIIRTYDKNNNITELICSGLVNEVV